MVMNHVFKLWKFISFIMNKRLRGGPCISFLGCGTKVPHILCLKTIEIYSLIVLGAHGSKSRCFQGQGLSEVSRKESFLDSF